MVLNSEGTWDAWFWFGTFWCSLKTWLSSFGTCWSRDLLMLTQNFFWYLLMTVHWMSVVNLWKQLTDLLVLSKGDLLKEHVTLYNNVSHWCVFNSFWSSVTQRKKMYQASCQCVSSVVFGFVDSKHEEWTSTEFESRSLLSGNVNLNELNTWTDWTFLLWFGWGRKKKKANKPQQWSHPLSQWLINSCKNKTTTGIHHALPIIT